MIINDNEQKKSEIVVKIVVKPKKIETQGLENPVFMRVSG